MASTPTTAPKAEGRVTTVGRLLDYSGSITDRHGYRQGEHCCRPDCARMRAAYLADPDGGSSLPDVRWLLHDRDTDGVVLAHVRPESFTPTPTTNRDA